MPPTSTIIQIQKIIHSDERNKPYNPLPTNKHKLGTCSLQFLPPFWAKIPTFKQFYQVS